ncbi:MAG: energy-coupling factor transporter ATPase [Ruminococcus sp.]|nr:energy-coupling factor transporter ATPase [Ruminococcus sp.]
MSNIIEIKDLHFSYDSSGENPVEVLKGINLNIQEGEFVAVLGHNGSGKSTLAKHINAILVPTSGKVIVNGIDTADENRLFELRQCAGMVFQNPDNQIVSSIVEEDVAFALENLGVPYEEMRRRVDDALKAVNMYDYRLHSPAQLSGGQKQRVAIAGIIAMQPKCIILDEPTAMLDPQGRREVMAVIKKMNREQGVTIVLITHYMDEAAQCGRVVVMDKGKIVLDDTPRAVFSHVDEIKKIGLDVPQVTELAWELRKAGINISSEIITEQECVEALKNLF